VPFEIQANGVVSPLSTSAITAQVDGLITHVYFKEGQNVEKGAMLFQIEARPYEAAYQQSLANLARDRETNANAQKEVARYVDLVQKDYVTQEQADQQKATAGAAAATGAGGSGGGGEREVQSRQHENSCADRGAHRRPAGARGERRATRARRRRSS